jgi:4-amino-4-deoxychorismate lyase
MSTTLINGKPVDSLDATDRGLHYGDGLFETIRCESGNPRWFERHLERLHNGCSRLGIDGLDTATLRTEVAALIAGQERAIIKIIVTRGPMLHRGYRPTGAESCTRIVSRLPWPTEAEAPLQVATAQLKLGVNPLLAGIKHLNRLEQVLAQQEAARRGLDEVLLLSSDGVPISGSMSNLIVCLPDVLLTPAVDSCGVAGVMRGLTLDAAVALAMPLTVAALSLETVQGASALYFCNVRWGLRPVSQWNGRILGVDVRARKLQDWINAQV